jgi:glycosyltransferase involved in cell wall biosynthesis
MKLVIQIPAFDEEATVGLAVRALPRRLEGVDEIEILVVDDGSTDGTAAAARQAGADRILSFRTHRGLAAAFAAGCAEALAMGADVIVNYDADNQYEPGDLPGLIAPILRGEADVVVGDRQPGRVAHFSPAKRLLQRWGSWVVRQAAGIDVPDAASGLRAFSREAASRIHVFSKLTYTLETLIQAAAKDMRLSWVRVRTRPVARPSRLFRSTSKYVLVQGANILRLTALYKPLKLFSAAAALLLLAGAALGVRFLLFYVFSSNPGGHVQSLILASILILAGLQAFFIALLADLVAINRTLLEGLEEKSRRRPEESSS